MERKTVEDFLLSNINKIYGFAVNHIYDKNDSEDLAQDICFVSFKYLCSKDIKKPENYLWVIARHCLAKYYKKKSEQNQKITDDDCEKIVDKNSQNFQNDFFENHQKLKIQIAYLSKLRRQIVILFYYENKKQSEIASILKIPVGTVKWHLNIAKQELKEGIEKMENMKEINNFKFNPIEFNGIKLYGLVGRLGTGDNIIRKGLIQNILYTIYNKSRAVNEIAEILNVSPVYIEYELEYLESFSLIIKDGKKYQANILIEERTKKTNGKRKSTLYKNRQ